MAKKKERLDKLLVARNLVPTRSKAQGLIMAGEVLVNGERVDKAGTAVLLDAVLELKSRLPYVGRGAYKLVGALDAFDIDVNGRLCADVGACTGGFTDVMLQRGAAKVYAIDVGSQQLHWKLRQDERVVVMERTNARYLESLPEIVSFAAIDVSFISLKLILPAVRQWLTDGAQRPDADIVALIKPQFEAGPEQVGKGGIVRKTAVHRQVLLNTLQWASANGFSIHGLIPSPIQGSTGNIEFLAWLQLKGDMAVDISALVDKTLSS